MEENRGRNITPSIAMMFGFWEESRKRASEFRHLCFSQCLIWHLCHLLFHNFLQIHSKLVTVFVFSDTFFSQAVQSQMNSKATGKHNDTRIWVVAWTLNTRTNATGFSSPFGTWCCVRQRELIWSSSFVATASASSVPPLCSSLLHSQFAVWDLSSEVSPAQRSYRGRNDWR